LINCWKDTVRVDARDRPTLAACQLYTTQSGYRVINDDADDGTVSISVAVTVTVSVFVCVRSGHVA